jgi:hypothetical protein
VQLPFFSAFLARFCFAITIMMEKQTNPALRSPYDWALGWIFQYSDDSVTARYYSPNVSRHDFTNEIRIHRTCSPYSFLLSLDSSHCSIPPALNNFKLSKKIFTICKALACQRIAIAVEALLTSVIVKGRCRMMGLHNAAEGRAMKSNSGSMKIMIWKKNERRKFRGLLYWPWLGV